MAYALARRIMPLSVRQRDRIIWSVWQRCSLTLCCRYPTIANYRVVAVGSTTALVMDTALNYNPIYLLPTDNCALSKLGLTAQLELCYSAGTP